jgi:hypothetical protein
MTAQAPSRAENPEKGLSVSRTRVFMSILLSCAFLVGCVIVEQPPETDIVATR